MEAAMCLVFNYTCIIMYVLYIESIIEVYVCHVLTS